MHSASMYLLSFSMQALFCLGRAVIMEYEIDKSVTNERLTRRESLFEDVKLSWNLIYKKEPTIRRWKIEHPRQREELRTYGGSELDMFEEVKKGRLGLHVVDKEDSI